MNERKATDCLFCADTNYIVVSGFNSVRPATRGEFEQGRAVACPACESKSGTEPLITFDSMS